MNSLRWKKIYEGGMIVLVIISLVAMMSNEESNFRYIHQIIWFIFLIDVLVRFIRTTVKWKYIKNNPFDIVTVIPLEDMMLLARFARFLRLFRYKNIVKRYVNGVSKKLEEIGFLRLSLGVLLFNILLSIGFFLFSDLRILESFIWVWGNFFKFNYETSLEGFVVLSVFIKIFGLIYIGIVIQEVMVIGRRLYEEYKNRKTVKKEEDEVN